MAGRALLEDRSNLKSCLSGQLAWTWEDSIESQLKNWGVDEDRGIKSKTISEES